jgi:hypothetical protein
MKYLLFVVLFQINLFAEQGAFLIVKDVKFAPFLKKTFFSGHDITSAKSSYDLEGNQVVLDEDITFSTYFSPLANSNHYDLVQNYLGSKVEIITRTGESESIEGILSSLNISVSEKWASKKDFRANHNLTSEKGGHSITVGEQRIPLENILEIRLLETRTIPLKDFAWLFPPYIVRDRTETTQLKVYGSVDISTFSARKVSDEDKMKMELFSRNVGKEVLVHVDSERAGTLSNITIGVVEGVGITSFSRRGFANDLYTGDYETSCDTIIPHKNYLILKVAGGKTVRLPIHKIQDVHVLVHGCTDSFLIAGQTSKASNLTF